MRDLENQASTSPFYDQTNRPQSSSLLLCSCCWPSRRTRETSSEANSFKQKTDKAVVVFKQEVSSSLRVINSPRHSLYLSMNDLNRPPSRNQLEVSTSRLSDADSIISQPFITARTSRSADERRHKSMPELVKEIHEEFVGKQLEEVKQQFMTFFRTGGNAEKPPLTSENHRVYNTTLTQAPLPPQKSPPSSTRTKIHILDFTTLNEAENPGTQPSPPLTSTSTVYMPHSVVPVRPFVSVVQRSLVRLPDHTYRSVLFFYYCIALGFQKLFSYGDNNQPAVSYKQDSRHHLAKHI